MCFCSRRFTQLTYTAVASQSEAIAVSAISYLSEKMQYEFFVIRGRCGEVARLRNFEPLFVLSNMLVSLGGAVALTTVNVLRIIHPAGVPVVQPHVCLDCLSFVCHIQCELRRWQVDPFGTLNAENVAQFAFLSIYMDEIFNIKASGRARIISPCVQCIARENSSCVCLLKTHN